MPENPVAASLAGLVELYRVQRRFAEAEGLSRDSIKICKESLGDRHPHTALSVENLAGLYHLQGKDADAEPLLIETTRSDELSRLLRARSVERGVGTVSPYPMLAAVLANLGKSASAYRALEAALARGASGRTSRAIGRRTFRR